MSSLVKSKLSVIDDTKGLIKDLEYQLKVARSPMRKRSIKRSLEYFEAVLYHLSTTTES